MRWIAGLRSFGLLIPDFKMLGCSLEGLAPGLAARVRHEQIKRLCILVTVMSLTGSWTVLLIGYEYWRTTSHTTLFGLGLAITLCYAVLVFMSIRCRFGDRLPVGGAERIRRRFVWVSLVLGIAWGTLNVVLMQTANPDGRNVLYAVITGLMSAGVLITPPSAAFAFWVPVSVGGTVALTVVSSARDMGGAVMLVGYTGLSLFCLLYLNRSMIQRVLAEVSQAEGRETIDMLLRDFEDSAGDWLWETDRHGQLSYVSHRFAQAARAPAEAIKGLDLVTFLDARRHRAKPHYSGRAPASPGLASYMTCHMPFRDVEVALEIDGRLVWWALTGKPRFSAQQMFEGYRGVGSEVTQAKLADSRADFLAHYDELTGLANRRLFKDQIQRRLSDREVPPVALLCLDLDGFKAINDTHGHPVGDQLLEAVARRLQRQVRDGDLTARLGGDEFAVVVGDSSAEVIESLATRLIGELSRPYGVGGIELRVGVSIGIAVATDGDRTEETLLRNADSALYQAKADGRGALRFFSQTLREMADRRRTLETELSEAIANDRLHLSYQPIFRLRDGTLDGVEALVRWNRRSGEALSPAEFVPLAENSQSIDELGEWVLTRACREARLLPRGTKLAVNVSALQFRGHQLVDYVTRALLTHGLDARRLQLELTETAFFEMSEVTLGMLHELRAHGIGISLDDFGVGHTSLGQLRRFPFSNLKIDRSFVQDLPGNPAARAIVKGLTCMAADMGLTVTAEGVETREQLELVRSANCDFAQGFLLSHPVALDALEDSVDRGSDVLMARKVLSAE